MAQLSGLRNASILVALLLAGPAQAGGEIAAHVMFVKGQVRVLDAAGQARPARQGEALRSGERMETASGSLGQIKLPDGSLVGVHSESEVAVETVAGDAAGARLVRLKRGAMRVINRDASGRNALLVETPTAELNLVNADTVAFVVDPVTGARDGLPSGTYSRVIAGDGTLRTARGGLSLQRGETGFASGGDVVPTSLPALPATLQTAMLAGTRPGR